VNVDGRPRICVPVIALPRFVAPCVIAIPPTLISTVRSVPADADAPSTPPFLGESLSTYFPGTSGVNVAVPIFPVLLAAVAM